VLTRRHIRVKVLQTIYAMHQSGSEQLDKEVKFLVSSMDSFQDLYLIAVDALVEMRAKELEFQEKSKKKHLVTSVDLNPNTRFIDNKVLIHFCESISLQDLIVKRKINNWKHNDDLIISLLEDVKNSEIYKEYMDQSVNNFETDRQFMYDIYTHVVAPNEKFYDYLEDYKLTWTDDIPLVNTLILKHLKTLKNTNQPFEVPALYKDDEDKDFGVELFKKTVLNEKSFAQEFIDRTPNWDPERISEVDTIMLKMAICEFLKFPSIPVKVTINEYLEIAKEYATPKSSLFINGILDSLVKDFQTNQRLNKSGRGLL
jgi:transcription antitermination protein NusB